MKTNINNIIIGFLIMFTVVMIFIFYVNVASINIPKINELNNIISTNNKLKNTKEINLKNKNINYKKLRQLSNNFENENISKKINNSTNLYESIIKIDELMTINNLSEKKLNIISTDKHDVEIKTDVINLDVTLIQVSGIGNFFDILKFLDDINKDYYFYRIDNVQIKELFFSDNQNSTDKELNMIISCFSLK